jgi:hypothetical protein
MFASGWLIYLNCNNYIRQYRHTCYSKHTPLDIIIVVCNNYTSSSITVLTPNGQFLDFATIAFSDRYVLADFTEFQCTVYTGTDTDHFPLVRYKFQVSTYSPCSEILRTDLIRNTYCRFPEAATPNPRS